MLLSWLVSSSELGDGNFLWIALAVTCHLLYTDTVILPDVLSLLLRLLLLQTPG